MSIGLSSAARVGDALGIDSGIGYRGHGCSTPTPIDATFDILGRVTEV